MDANMSDGEQWAREELAKGLKIPREQWGIESAPEVCLCIDDAQVLFAELDRLREFVDDVRRARVAATYNRESELIGKALSKLDARATGGEGT